MSQKHGSLGSVKQNDHEHHKIAQTHTLRALKQLTNSRLNRIHDACPAPAPHPPAQQSLCMSHKSLVSMKTTFEDKLFALLRPLIRLEKMIVFGGTSSRHWSKRVTASSTCNVVEKNILNAVLHAFYFVK